MDQKQKRKDNQFIVLVVCPKNIIGSWEDEIEAHLTKASVQVHLKKGVGKIPHDADYHFVITNYEQIRSKVDEYSGIEWDYIILDESHRIKNRKAKTTKAMWYLDAPYKTILSGTPITKDEIDLWAQYKWLNSRIMGDNFFQFANKALTKVKMGDYYVLKPNKKKISPFIKRASKFTHRIKLEEIAEIPAMMDIPIKLSIMGEAKKAYTELEKGFMTEYQGMRSTHKLNVTGMIRLQQITGGHLVLETNDVVRFKQQPKLLWLIDKIEDIGKEKLFIVCRYKHEIQLISSALKKMRVKHVIMQGGMSDAEIKKARKAFKEDKTCQVLIGQVAVVKEGNNFQKQCRYGVFYSKSLSYVDIEQCRRRLYRNGQNKKVVFYHLILRNTIDENIETIVEKKYLNAEEALLKLIMKGKSKMAKETTAKKAPAKKVEAKKTTTKKAVAKKATSKKAAPVGGERPEYGIEALAKKMGIEARALRIKLRNAEIEKSGKYYDFKSKEGVEKMANKLSPKKAA